MKRYRLEGRTPIPVDDLMEWARDFGISNRRVADTKLGPVRVSTVFLGLDHAWGAGPPLLFETMVFGGWLDQEQWRYSTYEEAERGHRAAVMKALLSLPLYLLRRER